MSGECVLIVANLLRVRIEERWAPVDLAGAGGVIVSNRRRVARLVNVDHSHRYPRVSLAGRKHYLHTLVAAAHIGPRPAGQLILHADDDPQNPDARNLRYGSYAHNSRDARLKRRKRA